MLKSEKPLRAKKVLRAKTTIKLVSGKVKTKPRLKTISKLKKEADIAFSKATRYRFADEVDGVYYAECITCQARKPISQLQCGHFMSRQYNILRYDERNTAPQCYGCNVMQQGKQYEFGLQIDLLYGDGTAKQLHKESKQSLQFKREDLLQIIEESKAQIQYYETKVLTYSKK